jgi:hypothetical protein
MGDLPELGAAPLRDAAIAQPQVRQAEKLARRAAFLSGVGILVALVGAALAVVEYMALK